MKQTNLSKLFKMAPHLSSPCVSIYARSSEELKKRVQEAERIALVDFDLETTTRVLEPVRRVLASPSHDGLRFPAAFFLAVGYGEFIPLQLEHDGIAVVSTGFHIKPLLRWLQRSSAFAAQTEKESIESYREAESRGETSTDLGEIVRAAIEQKVKHLFINESVNVWGQIHYQTGSVELHPNQTDAFDDDILDDLAELVIFGGGRVTVLPSREMPDGHDACAILQAQPRISRPTLDEPMDDALQ